MKITLCSVFVEDQDLALKFYTEVLGFLKKTEVPLGDAKWITVVSPEAPDGVELVLEPSDNPATQAFKKSLYEQGIPFNSFSVDNLQKEYERLRGLGVAFKMEPTQMEWGSFAIFDDTCGNLIQLHQR